MPRRPPCALACKHVGLATQHVQVIVSQLLTTDEVNPILELAARAQQSGVKAPASVPCRRAGVLAA
jgi:hypothetical protein